MVMVMRPLSQLIRRVNRSLILLVVARDCHSGAVSLQALERDALVDDVMGGFIVFWDFEFAGELDVVVLVVC